MLALRAWIGPFTMPLIGVRVGSPFTLETLFLIAIVTLAWLRPKSEPAVEAPLRWWGLGIVLVFVALCYARNLHDPFLSDDYIMVRAGHFSGAELLSTLHRAGGDGSFRPLRLLYLQTVGSGAGTDSFGWHLASLALHLINCALLYILVGKLWRNGALAFVSALLFGVHGSHPEVVVWMAAACDSLAAGFVLAATLAAVRTSERFSYKWLAVALLMTGCGILCKESAYAGPFVMAGFLLPVYGWRSAWNNPGVRSSVLGSCGVCAVLVAYRWFLFRGPGGYVDPASGRPMILSMHVATVAKALGVRIWDVLLFPINWDAPVTLWAGLGIVIGAAALVWSVRVANRTAIFALVAATVLAVLPAIHLASIGQSMLDSRILYLPSIPFAVMVASLVAGRPAGAAALIVASVMILEHDLNAWHRVALMAREACISGPADARMPATKEGVFFFQNGFAECVALNRAP